MTPKTRRALAVALAPFLLLALLYASRGLLVAPLLERALVAKARSALGLVLAVGAVDGTYLTSLEVRGLRTVEPSPEGPVRSLRAERIRLRYSLLALRGGLEGFLAEASLEADGLRAEIRVPGGGAEDGERPPAAAPSLPAALPRVQVRDAAITLEGSGYGVDASGIFLETGPRPGAAALSEVRLEVKEFLVRHPLLRESPVPLAATLAYGGGRIDIEGFSVNSEQIIEGGSVDLRGLPGSLAAAAEGALFGAPVEARLEKAGGEYRISLRAEGVDVAAVDALLARPLDAAGTLTARLSLRLRPGRLEEAGGEADLRLSRGKVGGVPVEEIAFRGTVAGGRLLAGSLEAAVGRNRLSLAEASFDLPSILAGKAAAVAGSWEGVFDAECRDLPSLFALFGLETGAVLEKGAPPHGLLLRGSLAAASLHVDEGSLAVGEGDVGMRGVVVTLPPPGGRWDETSLGGEVTVDLPDLGLIGEVFPVTVRLGGSLEADLRLEGPLTSLRGRGTARSRGLVVGDLPLGDIDLLASADSQAVLVEKGLWRQAAGNELSLRGVSAPAALLFRGPWQELLRRLEGDLSLVLDDIPAFFDLFGVKLAPAGGTVPPHRLFLEGRAGEGRLALSAGSLDVGGGTVTLAGGAYRLAPPGGGWREASLEADLAVNLPDISLLPSLFPLPPLEGSLRGRVRIEGPLGGLSGDGSLEGKGAVIRGILLGDVRLDASAGEGRVNVRSLEARNGKDFFTGKGGYEIASSQLRSVEARFSLEDLADYAAALPPQWSDTAGSLRGALTADGPLGGLSADFEARLRDARLRGVEISGAGVKGTVRDGTASLEEFSVSTSAGGGEGAGSVRLEEGAYQVDVTGLRLAWKGRELEVAEGASLSLSGLPDAPSLRARGRLDRITDALGGVSEAQFDVGYSGGQLSIDEFRWSSDALGRVDLAGTMPLDPFGGALFPAGEIRLKGEVDLPEIAGLASLLPLPVSGVEGAATAHLSLAGTWREPRGDLQVEASEVKIAGEGRLMPPGPFTFSAQARLLGGELSVERIDLRSPGLSVTGSGGLSGLPSLPAALEDRSPLRDAAVRLQGKVASQDLAWVRPLVPGLRHLGGAVEGDLSVTGPLPAPDVTARLRVSKGSFRYGTVVPPVDLLELEASVSKGRIVLEEASGELGGSPFRLEGSLAYGGGDFTVDAKIEGRNILLYRGRGVSLRADTNLAVSGPKEKLRVSGRVDLVNSRYMRNFYITDFIAGEGRPRSVSGPGLFSFRDPPLKGMVFDVKLGSKDPFLVRSNVARGSVRPDLTISGTGEIPVLVGKVYIDAGRVALPGGTLRIERGFVSFPERNPDRPEVEVSAFTKLMGYDITVQATGPLADPEIVLSSIPPLPNDELLALVLAGQPPASLEGDQARSAMGTQMAVFLGRNFLSKILGGSFSDTEELIEDRFEIEVGKEVTESGAATFDARFRVRDDVLGKGDTLYLTSEKDVYDDYNFGVRIVFKFR